MPVPTSTPVSKRDLFGGALSIYLPSTFIDVSEIRQVPDYQEVFSDPQTDQCLMIDLLEHDPLADDDRASENHFYQLAHDQGTHEVKLTETRRITGEDIPQALKENENVVVSLTIGQTMVKKSRQGREEKDCVNIYLACVRLKQVKTDACVIFNDPIHTEDQEEELRKSPLERRQAMQLFKQVLSTFAIHDYGLFATSET